MLASKSSAGIVSAGCAGCAAQREHRAPTRPVSRRQRAIGVGFGVTLRVAFHLLGMRRARTSEVSCSGIDVC
jgi:hypothetical protein